MPDPKRADSLVRVAAGDPSGGGGQQEPAREKTFFVCEDAAPPLGAFERALAFQYKGDVFAQRGVYADAALYMSRLPPTRKAAAIRPRAGAKYTQQVRLAPMTPPGSEERASERTSKAGRKRQYMAAVEAMAANPALLPNLLRDNVVPNVLALCRTKDAAALASCVSTLCHLSCDAAGRQAILSHNALAVLIGLVASAAHEKRILSNALATLANLTIEDTCESAFVKEKALESLVKSCKASALAGEMASFAIYNLSCPSHSYPRVEDAVRALVDFAKDARDEGRDREVLSRALYNFSSTKTNQLKLIETAESLSVLRAYISSTDADAVRWNALVSFWHLSTNGACRRAVIRGDCVRALVRELHSLTDDQHVKCALLTLLNLSLEPVARELMGSAGGLDALDQLSKRALHSADLQVLIYELIALIVSDPNNVHTVSEAFFRFLLSFEHSAESKRSNMSCYVLFSATCILSWSDQEGGGGIITRDVTSGALVTDTATDSASLRSAQSLEELLDEPQHLHLIYRHVACGGFDAKSSELYLQVLLLYNLTFRYNKVDVAKLAATWMLALASSSSEERILSLLCGTYFNLCQEYEVHAVLSASGTFGVLERFTRLCDADTKCMCLEIVSIVFDGRQLAQPELVALAVKLLPMLGKICAGGGAAIRAGCAACFARFAMVDECRKPMVDSGLISSLEILASEDDAQTLRLCVHAYSYLSRNASVCAKLIRSGIVKALTYLAAAPEEAVRRACAMTLCNMSASEDNIDALVKFGALRALLVISCVKSKDPETRRICLKAVMNLLRHAANVAQMCQDGLLWGFGLFAAAMEPQDFDLIADAFCVLSFYPATRKGATASATLAQLFEILHAPAPLQTKVKVLKCVSNLLCDPSSASVLVGAGLLPHLVRVVDEERRDADVKALVAQLFALLLQSTPDAEAEFAHPSTMRAVAQVMTGERDDCAACCCVLLLRMSALPQTRRAMVETLAALPSLFVQAARDAQAHLVRCVYNLSCDVELLPVVTSVELLPLVAMAVHSHAYASGIAKLGAGVLRNLSCAAACHESLMADTSMALLRDLFDVDDSQCREDVSICACNLFLGKSNSSFLLSMSLLPLILWLCGHPVAANRALCSGVLRKLALAPGNIETLVDGGAVGPLALLLQQNASLYVKKNCVAVLCLLSQRPGVPSVLGSVGILSCVLELLEDGDASERAEDDPLFEAMCAHLLSALAEFARVDDPREGRIASVLYDLMDRDASSHVGDGGGGGSANRTWQSDRTFLIRDASADAQHHLPAPQLSSAHWVAPSQLPVFSATLYPLLSRGYSAEFDLVANRVDTHTIEPLVPDFYALRDASSGVTSSDGDGDGDGSDGDDDGDSRGEEPPRKHRHHNQQQRRAAFVPPDMFAKNRTPFAPAPVPQSPLSSMQNTQNKLPSSEGDADTDPNGADPPKTQVSRKAPPLLRH